MQEVALAALPQSVWSDAASDDESIATVNDEVEERVSSKRSSHSNSPPLRTPTRKVIDPDEATHFVLHSTPESNVDISALPRANFPSLKIEEIDLPPNARSTKLDRALISSEALNTGSTYFRSFNFLICDVYECFRSYESCFIQFMTRGFVR